MMLGVSYCAHEKHSKEKSMNTTNTRVFPIVVLAGLAAIYAQRVSVWFNKLQPVSDGFSTTFTFQTTPPTQIPDNPPPPPFPADGFAIRDPKLGIGIEGTRTGRRGNRVTVALATLPASTTASRLSSIPSPMSGTSSETSTVRPGHMGDRS
jgi:hypothetical protein